MLALVPAGFLVLLVLAAIAVDSAVALLGQRQLADLTAAAANDAAGAALSDRAFYGSGVVEVDPTAAARVACDVLAATGGGAVHGIRLWVAVAGPVVAVRASGSVDAVFGRRLPGTTRTVSAAAAATAATAATAAGAAGGAPAPAAFAPADCHI
ncbi:MAG TPA: hypothetical protein VFP61_06815 [Acidimicrobiales bacterium]|nr:hypothetical protein [Acidimicrobiales bacterium]